MSKIIVRRQEYANNGTHANEIEAVVQQNLIANTLSSATDIAASVGLVKSETDAIKESLTSLADSGVFTPVPKSGATAVTEGTGYYSKFGNIVIVSYLYWGMQLTGADSSQFTLNLPYKNETIRAYGMLGYHNFGASQVPLMLSSMQTVPDRVGLQKQTGQGDSVLHGTDLTGSYTWQGTIIYYTDGTKLV